MIAQKGVARDNKRKDENKKGGWCDLDGLYMCEYRGNKNSKNLSVSRTNGDENGEQGSRIADEGIIEWGRPSV